MMISFAGTGTHISSRFHPQVITSELVSAFMMRVLINCYASFVNRDGCRFSRVTVDDECWASIQEDSKLLH